MGDVALNMTQQYLTFCLGSEIFAVDVAKTREVLDYINITEVPQTPDYMLGVINLRGSAVPVIDMRHKFGMEASEHTVDTCIVVLEVNVDGESTVIGALADSVSEVLAINLDQIEPPPRLGTKLNTEYICGIGNCENGFVILLDIDKLFSADEVGQIQSMHHETDEHIKQ